MAGVFRIFVAGRRHEVAGRLLSPSRVRLVRVASPARHEQRRGLPAASRRARAVPMSVVPRIVRVVFQRSPGPRLTVDGARQVGDGVRGPRRRDGRQPAAAAGVPATAAAAAAAVVILVRRPGTTQRSGRLRSTESAGAAAAR